MYLVVSVCPFVCLSVLSQLNRLTFCRGQKCALRVITKGNALEPGTIILCAHFPNFTQLEESRRLWISSRVVNSRSIVNKNLDVLFCHYESIRLFSIETVQDPCAHRHASTTHCLSAMQSIMNSIILKRTDKIFQVIWYTLQNTPTAEPLS